MGYEYLTIFNPEKDENKLSDVEHFRGRPNVIDKKFCILLKGPPGSTKSTYAYYLASHLYEHGEVPLEYVNSHSKIYLLDTGIEIYQKQVTGCIGNAGIFDKIVETVLYKDISFKNVSIDNRSKIDVFDKKYIKKGLQSSWKIEDGVIVIDSASSLFPVGFNTPELAPVDIIYIEGIDYA